MLEVERGERIGYNLDMKTKDGMAMQEKLKMKAAQKHQRLIVGICTGVIAVSGVVALIFVDYVAIADWLKGLGYEPSTEMQSLIADVDFTGRGELVLKASQPTLLARADFNHTCESHNPDLSVLGCYTAERIYVYDVRSEELAGVRQSTLAHELLHAVWWRLSDGERDQLVPGLQEVYESNLDELKPRLDKYPEESFYDELHSIVGTEIVPEDLSSGLAEHYVMYFNDHTKMVGYHEAYAEKFQKLEDEANALYTEITANQERINAETTNYNDGMSELNAAILDFNRRAMNGSFASEAAFDAERAALVSKQAALETLYGSISTLISDTNALIDQYNNNITRTQELMDSINSNVVKPESAVDK